jgi:hypothetical protein
LYRIPIDSRLPTIRIPLRLQDSDAQLNLQAIFEQTYENGAYDATDYTQKPIPAFTAEEAAFANQVLASAGKR